MFPYPSGAGLHVGHPKGYTATDIVSRYYHAKGYNVLHPMGFDAFGLPAENYAVKTGTHPRITTEANIATFTSQMKALGFSYDWDRMVDTTDPEYYRWTQWIFLELFKRGLAYEAEMPVNWCPALKAVLANEEVVDGKSEIGGHPVEKKLLRQWVLKITEYADRLIEDLDGLDWPEGIKEMQRNWIGKSEGCEFRLMKSVGRKIISQLLLDCQTESVKSKNHLLRSEVVQAKLYACNDEFLTMDFYSEIVPLIALLGDEFDYEQELHNLLRKYNLERIRRPIALLLHGWDNVENHTDWHWMSSTKTELEKIGYEVIMEQLPGNNAPDLEKQLAFLEQFKDRLDERSVIIGHSMGGFLGMHFVA